MFKVNTNNPYIKNYLFTFDFGHAWGNCDVVMTCVSGHLTTISFDDRIEKGDWHEPAPDELFSAPVRVKIEEVFSHASGIAIHTLISPDI